MTAATAPRSRSADKRYYGVVEALVVAVFDDADEARVRVKFPWFDASMTSDWCRVAQPYAGNGYGFVFVPEEGDEVLVAFVHGDMRMPIVIGGLYNGVDKPPTAKKKDKDQKLVRTKAGHELLLDDSPKSEKVHVKTKGGHTLDLDDTGKKVTVKSSGTHTVELDDSGKKVTVKSSGGHTVVMDDNGKSVEIKTVAGQSVKLDASGVTITGATVKLDAGQVDIGKAATHQVLYGELFMALFNAHVHTTTFPTLPTSPPLTPMTPAMLSTTVKTQ